MMFFAVKLQMSIAPRDATRLRRPPPNQGKPAESSVANVPRRETAAPPPPRATQRFNLTCNLGVRRVSMEFPAPV